VQPNEATVHDCVRSLQSSQTGRRGRHAGKDAGWSLAEWSPTDEVTSPTSSAITKIGRRKIKAPTVSAQERVLLRPEHMRRSSAKVVLLPTEIKQPRTGSGGPCVLMAAARDPPERPKRPEVRAGGLPSQSHAQQGQDSYNHLDLARDGVKRAQCDRAAGPQDDRAADAADAAAAAHIFPKRHVHRPPALSTVPETSVSIPPEAGRRVVSPLSSPWLSSLKDSLGELFTRNAQSDVASVAAHQLPATSLHFVSATNVA